MGCGLLPRGRGIAIFSGFSLYRMSYVIVMTSGGFSKLLEFPATPMIGDMKPYLFVYVRVYFPYPFITVV